MIYNIVFLSNKMITEYLNLSKKEFFNKLWEYTYVDDLWDFIEETEPTEEELMSYLYNVFIDENMFHHWEDDDMDCYAFYVEEKTYNIPETKIFTYNEDKELEDFIMSKILARYYKENEQFFSRGRRRSI